MSRDNRLKQQIFDVKLREEERGMGISIDFLVNDRTRWNRSNKPRICRTAIQIDIHESSITVHNECVNITRVTKSIRLMEISW